MPSWSVSLVPLMTMSSAMAVVPCRGLMTLSNLSWNTSLAILSPNGSLSHLNFPHGVLNVVRRLLLRLSVTCQYPELASHRVMWVASARSGSTSSIVLAYQAFLSIALFRSLGSRHRRMLPSGFRTGTIELTHSVYWSLTSVMTFSFTNLSSSALYASLMPTGHDRGGCCTGT